MRAQAERRRVGDGNREALATDRTQERRECGDNGFLFHISLFKLITLFEAPKCYSRDWELRGWRDHPMIL